MQLLRCATCGEEINSLAYPSEHIVDPPLVRVLLKWDRVPPNASDAFALRRLLPTTTNIGVTEILRKLRAERRWDAGTYPGFHASEIRRKAMELGIDVELREIEE
jgi:hypothetical protein